MRVLLWCAICVAFVSGQLSGASVCDYPLRPGSRTLNAAAIRDSYGNFIFRLFAGEEQGTGFSLDPVSGYVLTAFHVIRTANGGDIKGDLPSRPGTFFHFSLVKPLCTSWVNGQCQDQAGGDAGVDAALLKMQDDDLARYRQMLSAQAPFDLSLGLDITDVVYKAGYPRQGNPSSFAQLSSDGQITVIRDWTQNNQDHPHREWRLSQSVSPGESGSPVFDANGNVFAILLDQATDDQSKGIALNLTEITDLLSIIFRDMPRSPNGQHLRQALSNDGYQSEREAAEDLLPVAITNKELAAVILDVTANGVPKFRFRHCPVDYALIYRRLDGLYSRWEPDDNTADVKIQGAALIRDAAGLLASGQPEQAAERFVSAYRLSSAGKTSQTTDRIQLLSALGAAKTYNQLDDFDEGMKYTDQALRLGYKLDSKEHVALASTYRFDAARAKGNSAEAAKSARVAFTQAPATVYTSFDTVPEKEHFRLTGAKKLSANDWEEITSEQQKHLETKLFASPAKDILSTKTKK